MATFVTSSRGLKSVQKLFAACISFRTKMEVDLKYTLPNEERKLKKKFPISDNLQIEYENLNCSIGALHILDDAGQKVDRHVARVRIQDDGEDILESAWLSDSSAVFFQALPRGNANKHTVLQNGRQVLSFQPKASVHVSHTVTGAWIQRDALSSGRI